MQRFLNVLGRTLFLGAMGLLAACGSVDGDNGGGGSGGAGGGDGPRGPGSGGAGGSTDGGGAGGSDDTGSPDALQACLDYCDEVSQCDDPGASCADDFCEDQLQRAGAECEDEFGAAFACFLPLATVQCGFEPPDACRDEIDALEACTALHGCGGQLCQGGGGAEGETCGCVSTCQGKRYETQCDTLAGGDTTCVCLVDDVEVGTCEGESATACGVKESCCQTEYFNIP
ncbi:hypothetical protein [Sorangium sp. So ce176]|uniref:hypothetical protein n=1 Tax=Sorangium sp. So ce176 TaxID=3133286 RepID=UPI003F64406F